MNAIDQEPAPARLRNVWWRFLMIFVPLLLVACGTVTYLYRQQHESDQAVLVINQRHLVALQSSSLMDDFGAVVASVKALAGKRNETLARALTSEDRKQALEQLYIQFQSFLLQNRGMYAQVRLINEAKNNLLVIRWGQREPDDVAKSIHPLPREVQFFDEVMRLNPGDVLVSSLDYHAERSAKDQPLRPIIHYAAPVFDTMDRRRGAVIVDFRAERLLEQLRAGTSLVEQLTRAVIKDVASDVMLVDAQGRRIIGPNSQQDSALEFIPPGRAKSSFAQEFPDAWKAMQKGPGGQFVNQAGMFTFHSLDPAAQPLPAKAETPDSGAEEPQTASTWKLVSHVTPEVFAARRKQMFGGIWRWSALVAMLLAAGSWMLAEETIDRRRAAAGMKRNEERFRQLAEHIEEAFWIASADGQQLVYVSPAYELIWGRSLRDLYQRPVEWLEAIHPNDQSKRAEAFAHAADQGHFDVEYRVLRPDGETRWIRERGFAIRNEEGQVYRVAGIAGDTTALHEAREKGLQSERLAAVGEAMTGLAHESRNALQRSQAGLEMLAKRLKDRPESMELLAEVQKSQYYLYDLYEEVRGYARPIHLRRESIDLGRVLRDTWGELSEQRKGKSEQLIEESCEVSLDCYADPRSIGQVFRNILENALAANGESGEIQVHWSDAVLGERPALQVAIRDSGPGLSPEQQRRIFTPFFTTKAQGTGLGMAISKRIIDAHEGEIAVGSSDGESAEIVVTLPRSTA